MGNTFIGLGQPITGATCPVVVNCQTLHGAYDKETQGSLSLSLSVTNPFCKAKNVSKWMAVLFTHHTLYKPHQLSLYNSSLSLSLSLSLSQWQPCILLLWPLQSHTICCSHALPQVLSSSFFLQKFITFSFLLVHVNWKVSNSHFSASGFYQCWIVYLYVTSLLEILHFYAIFLIFVGGIFVCEMGIWVYLKFFKNLIVYNCRRM